MGAWRAFLGRDDGGAASGGRSVARCSLFMPAFGISCVNLSADCAKSSENSINNKKAAAWFAWKEEGDSYLLPACRSVFSMIYQW